MSKKIVEAAELFKSLKPGDFITFYISCNADRKLYQGLVQHKNGWGLVTIIHGVQYELKKLIDINIQTVFKKGDKVKTYFNKQGTDCNKAKSNTYNNLRIGIVQHCQFSLNRNTFEYLCYPIHNNGFFRTELEDLTLSI